MAKRDPVVQPRRSRAAICLALPEVTERLSHGAPTWFVRDKKTVATVWDDHHGDGRLALDLRRAARRAATARRRGARARSTSRRTSEAAAGSAYGST